MAWLPRSMCTTDRGCRNWPARHAAVARGVPPAAVVDRLMDPGCVILGPGGWSHRIGLGCSGIRLTIAWLRPRCSHGQEPSPG
jgi:hypothetical protein